MASLRVAASIFDFSDPRIAAAWIAAGVSLLVAILSAPLRLWVEKRLLRHKGRVEYEYEQRKALRNQIGQYHGRLHDAGFHLRRRLVNFEHNWQEGWMRRDGDYSEPIGERYYFKTFLHRFMVFMALANKFGRAAIHVDNRAADPADRYFVGYLNAMEWALTDVVLFKTEDYDASADTAHFYTDHFRRMCATLLDDDGDPLELKEFEYLLDSGRHELHRVLAFFDGIEPELPQDPGRRDLRWDRLIVFRLLLMGFVTTVGYDYERDPSEWFERVANLIEHPGIAATAADWVPRFGLARGHWYSRHGDRPGREIVRALRSRAKRLEDAI